MADCPLMVPIGPQISSHGAVQPELLMGPWHLVSEGSVETSKAHHITGSVLWCTVAGADSQGKTVEGQQSHTAKVVVRESSGQWGPFFLWQDM